MAWLFTLMSLLAFGAVTSEEGNSPTPQTGRRGKCNFHFNIEQPQKHIMPLKDIYLWAFCTLNHGQLDYSGLGSPEKGQFFLIN